MSEASYEFENILNQLGELARARETIGKLEDDMPAVAERQTQGVWSDAPEAVDFAERYRASVKSFSTELSRNRQKVDEMYNALRAAADQMAQEDEVMALRLAGLDASLPAEN